MNQDDIDFQAQTSGSVHISESTSAVASSTPHLTVDDFEMLARRVDDAVAEVNALPAEARGKALELKATIEEFHKVGLTHIVKSLKADPAGKSILFSLVDEPAVYALFSMHGLVRADLKTQVSRVIDMVRPYLESHGGNVELLDVQNKVVYVRLIGNCHGCSMSQVTLKNTVEETLRQQIPDIVAVDVVAGSTPTVSGLVQLQPTPSREPDLGWVAGPHVEDLPADRPFTSTHEGIDILILPTSQGWRAYRNACAHQGLPLDGGLLDVEQGAITCPWHGFQFDIHSGECFSAPQCQLEPFPLRISENRIWVRPTT
ncbi:MAG TPA: NifU family protein [Pirellulaceae bacterium]|nr:NifU family protein [Pirellulaceae bacterium]HMO94157.1 NifU family protein [Pirellulaceae bacterium]HMP71172.1 NifU family protein [Pirellulaceae bacterium]